GQRVGIRHMAWCRSEVLRVAGRRGNTQFTDQPGKGRFPAAKVVKASFPFERKASWNRLRVDQDSIDEERDLFTVKDTGHMGRLFLPHRLPLAGSSDARFRGASVERELPDLTGA